MRRRRRSGDIPPTALLLFLVACARVPPAGGAGGSTRTATFTLSSSETATLTLPTGTESATESATASETESASLSESASHTESWRALNNYTAWLAPDTLRFYEGQEIRVKLRATLDDASGSWPQRGFDANATRIAAAPAPRGNLVLRTYRHVAAAEGDCGRMASAEYGGGYVLQETDNYGVEYADYAAGDTLHTATAYATIDAPHHAHPFIVCFMHTVSDTFGTPYRDEWRLLRLSDRGGAYVFQSRALAVKYAIADPTEGQHVAVELTSTETFFNFTVPPSRCADVGRSRCGAGDFLKLVPQGRPCTVERMSDDYARGLRYHGSAATDDDGAWASDSAVLYGMFEEATDGGVAGIGTRTRNPFVDSWEGYANPPDLTPEVAARQTSYAYVTLPAANGTYDVCFSAVDLRRTLRLLNNSGVPDVPLWVKLFPAVSQPGRAGGTTAFEVFAETLTWAVDDATPDTWGPVYFSDPRAGLDSTPHAPKGARYAAAAASTAGEAGWWFERDYYLPAGGDAFKLVPQVLLEADRAGPKYNGTERGHAGQRFGTLPGVGCWHPQGATELYERHALRARGSEDLEGASSLVSTTQSFVHIPADPSAALRVCYRRTCSAAAAGDARCAKAAGYRLLTTTLRPAVPTAGDAVFDTGAPLSAAMPPPSVTWAMNDTREGTWGALLLEVAAAQDQTVLLDSRPWSAGGNGSAVRLVRSDRGCDYRGFEADAAGSAAEPAVGAEAVDGGMPECDSLSAGTADPYCAGSLSDSVNATVAAYYLRVPVQGHAYRVCFKQGRWNWRAPVWAVTGAASLLWPAANPLDDVSIVSTEYRERQEALFYVTSTVPGGLVPLPRVPCPGGCAASGDVLRLVSIMENCDVNPLSWDAGLADTYLSPRCPVSGYGTLATTGLFGSAQCASAASVAAVCSGTSPCSDATKAASLAALAAAQPSGFFDDITPGDVSVSDGMQSLAAVVRLPAFLKGSSFGNTYKVCYKQAVHQNWMEANYTITVKTTDVASATLTPAPGSTTRHLLAGEHQNFTMEWRSINSPELQEWSASGGFAAKLVPVVRGLQNQNCLQPPGSTEASVFTSSTHSAFKVSQKVLQFSLTVPHHSGAYALCLRVGHSMSWYSPGHTSGTYRVVDNGVRWYVAPGMQPKNNGVSVVSLLRCTPFYSSEGALSGCGRVQTTENFDTSPGVDSAKVVPVSQQCPSGSHVGLEGGGVAGATDLGPGNGASDVAEFVTTLPAAPADAATVYRVCVRTTFSDAAFGGPRVAWVEATQADWAPSELRMVRGHRDAAAASLFETLPSGVSHYAVSPRLQPFSADSPAWVHNATTPTLGLSGALTVVVADPFSAAPPATPEHGFTFTAHVPGASLPGFGVGSSFKLVERKDARSNCLALPVDSTSNTGAGRVCRPGACVRLTNNTQTDAALPAAVHAVFQLPVGPGDYLVCFRLHAAPDDLQPWQAVPNAYGSYTFRSIDALLGADVTTANATLLDTAVRGGVPISSWCDDASTAHVTGGVPCAAANNLGYQHDLFTVVNGSDLCPTPTVAPLGSASASAAVQWWVLSPITNISVALQGTGANDFGVFYSMPPQYPAPTGQYRLCLYKAAHPWYATYATGHASKGGVVYQLLNRGTAREGGGTGYWMQAGAQGASDPAALSVESLLQYNTSTRFSEFTPDVPVRYADEAVGSYLVDPDTKQFSRTPLVRSGAVAEYRVQVVSADGAPLAFGSHPVTVVRCFTLPANNWEGLKCQHYRDAASGDLSGELFEIEVAEGSCPAAKAPAFGWPATGSRQFLSDGAVSFKVQYKSRCRGGFGCGIRFMADVGGGVQVFSSPFWVNVYERYADDVTLHRAGPPLGSTTGDGDAAAAALEKFAEASTPDFPEPYVLADCLHNSPCTLVAEAYWSGFREYAARGNVTLRYSAWDYGGRGPEAAAELLGRHIEAASFPEVTPGTAWSSRGQWRHTYRVRLVPQMREATLFLNMTFGEGEFRRWKRVVLRVTRAAPAAVKPIRVTPLDAAAGVAASAASRLSGAAAGRPPAQAFLAEYQADTNTLLAVEGAALESLVPYELVYEPITAAGELIPPSAELDGWVITTFIEGRGATANAVLGVATDADGAPASGNLDTTPPMLSLPLDPTPSAGVDGLWRLQFRMQNSFGCSRFGDLGGCIVTFIFTRDSTTIEVRVHTPVRVVASTVRVTPSQAVATVREGVLVTAEPGTPCGPNCWFADEFHGGHIFALINGPGRTDGVFSSDLATLLPSPGHDGCAFVTPTRTCSVHRYSPRLLQDPDTGVLTWAAQWVLRTDRPCIDCDFTFHSTMGGSPDSFGVDGGGSGEGLVGGARVSLEDEPMALVCAAHPPSIRFFAGEAASEAFTVTATAVAEGTVAGHVTQPPVLYPRWWVFCDPVTGLRLRDQADNLVLSRHGSIRLGQLLSTRMTGGVGAANMTGLYFAGASPTSAGPLAGQVELSLYAIGTVYSNAMPGSKPARQVTFNCTAAVTVVGVENTVTKDVRVKLPGATPLCKNATEDGTLPGAPGEREQTCGEWSVSMKDVREGIRVSATFVDVFANGDAVVNTAAENVTVRPLGGPNSRPRNDSPTWLWNATANHWATGVVLDSEFNPAILPVKDRTSYTNGAADLSLTRTFAEPATIVMRYRTAVESPVRKMVFQVCRSVYNEVRETDEYILPCQEVAVWIRLPPSVAKRIVVWSEPPAGALHRGASHACGAQPTEVSLVLAGFLEAARGPANTRFFVYGLPVAYSIEYPGQLLVPAGGAVTNATLIVGNGVAPSADAADELRSTAFHFVTARFYGMDLAGNATHRHPFSVRGATLHEPREFLVSATTASEYTFAQPAEEYEAFDLAPAGVQLDDDCLSRRFLETTDQNYRSFAPSPGRGWDYSQEAAAGLPFPVQATVRVAGHQPAWTFRSTFIRVSKHSWSGCNDGGSLSVYSLRRPLSDDTVTLRHGNLSRSWVRDEPTATMVRTHMGTAVAWPVLSQPCERCTLSFDLCFVGSKTAEDCRRMARASSDPSDLRPTYSERTQVTKPFVVRPARATSVSVVRQNLPHHAAGPGGGGGGVGGAPLKSIQVGQPFDVLLVQTQVFGGMWTLASNRLAVLEVTVSTVWLPPAADGHSPRSMRYGNGGFLHEAPAGANRTRSETCGVGEAEFAAAVASFTTVLDPLTGNRLRFMFTRPCSRCRVHVAYRLLDTAAATPDAAVVSGSFFLRDYAEGDGVARMPVVGSVLEYLVATCGAQWMLLRTAAPTVVRRRRPFSVTSLRVDRHGVPSHDAGDSLVKVVAKGAGSAGNGAGGLGTVTSPLDGVSVQAVEGSATMRLEYTRACYVCALIMGVHEHKLAVMTTATQLVVAPTLQRNSPSLRMTFDPVRNATWDFLVYAADELGDRAYTLGGPTYAAFLPRYAVLRGIGLLLDVVRPAETTYPVVHGTQPVRLRAGAPRARLERGRRFFNGIPADPDATWDALDAVGVATVSLDREPTSRFPLALTLAEANNGVPVPTPPTRFFGTKKRPLLSSDIVPTVMVVDDPELAGCKSPVRAGEACTVRVYLAGVTTQQVDGVEVSTYFHATQHAPGTFARLTHECDHCRLTHNVTEEFVGGVAAFTLAASWMDAECLCKVSVEPPASIFDQVRFLLTGDDQKARLLVRFEAAFVTQWGWVPSPTLPAAAVNGTGAAAVVYEAPAARRRRVSLWLGAYDVTRRRMPHDSVAFSNSRYVVVDPAGMTPPGCFVCMENDPYSLTPLCQFHRPSSHEVEIVGYFDTAGTCELGGSAVRLLPRSEAGDTSVSMPLRVSVQDGVSVVLSAGGVRKTTARTESGVPAAVVGIGAEFTIEVVAADGSRVLGDHHTRLTLLGGVNENNTAVSSPVTVSDGAYTFTADSPFPTEPDDEGFTYVVVAQTPIVIPSPLPVDGGTAGTAPEPAREELRNLTGATEVAGIGPVFFVGRPQAFEVYGIFVNRRAGGVVRTKLTSSAAFGPEEQAEDAEGDEAGMGVDGPLELREEVDVRPPVRWVRGYPFQLEILVRTHSGDVDEDFAEFHAHVAPVAVPCLEQDAGFTSSCIRGKLEGSCFQASPDRVPPCTTAGWVVGGSRLAAAYPVKVSGGRAAVDLIYAAPAAGVARLAVTTSTLGFVRPDSVLRMPEENTVVATVIFQELQKLSVRGAAHEACVQDTGGLWVYVILSSHHPHPTRTTIHTHSCPMVSTYERHSVLEPMVLQVDLLDRWNEPVVGDNDSSVVLTSRCLSGHSLAGLAMPGVWLTYTPFALTATPSFHRAEST